MKVSLKQGRVSITLKPGNTVTMEQVRKAIEDDAFKPKNASVVAMGELIPSGSKLQFKVAGTNELFSVAAPTHMQHMPWQQETGRVVLATGLISAPAKGTEGGTLQIVSASPLATRK